MKIYVVADGDYSDYHIEAVFTNKKKATKFAALHGFSYVSEWEADEGKIDTDIEVCVVHAFSVYNGLFDLNTHYFSDKKVEGIRTSSFGDVTIYVSLEEFDSCKAKKIAEDMYAQWKYEQIEKDERRK